MPEHRPVSVPRKGLSPRPNLFHLFVYAVELLPNFRSYSIETGASPVALNKEKNFNNLKLTCELGPGHHFAPFWPRSAPSSFSNGYPRPLMEAETEQFFSANAALKIKLWKARLAWLPRESLSAKPGE